MTTIPSAAIVGAGLMGRWHAHACRRAGGRVAAVVDVDAEAAARLASAIGHGARAAPSLDAVPASVALDVVHVCTPAETHVDVVRAAIARRCRVIVEKPLAPDAAATDGLLDDAASAGTWILPVHQTVFQSGVERARRWAEGRTVRTFDYRACSAGALLTPGLADVIAAEILPHSLSLLEVFAPGALDPDAAAPLRWDVQRPEAGEIAASATAGAMVVRLLVSMHARPTRHELQLLADAGTMHVDLFHGFAWHEPGRTPSRAWKVARPFAAAAVSTAAAGANLARRVLSREPAYPGLAALIARAYGALDDPARRPLSDRHTRAVARARDAILRQAARG